MAKKKAEGADQGADSKPDILAIIATDEHAGVGGSYVLDPLTGKREKVISETENEGVKHA